MKFIHLSDIRIGSPTESGRHWSDARLDERFRTLSRVLDYARDNDADLVLIAGGLFSHQPVTAEMDRVNALFKEHSDQQIVIIAGESDRLRASSPVRSYVWAPNVHYILSGTVERVVLPELKTEICAASATDEQNADPASFGLADIKAFITSRPSEDFTLEDIRRYTGRPVIRIAMLRGRDSEAFSRAFEKTDFTYVAAGISGSAKEILPGRIYSPGGLEPEAMSDSGSHGIYMGEADEETGALREIHFVPMASASYIPLLIGVTRNSTAEELGRMIAGEIRRRGEKNIYRLKLTGSRDPEQDFDLEELKKTYRIAEIIDETEPEYDFETLFKEHPQDMIGYYIGTIVNSGKEMSPTEKKAMYYGIDALLRTKA
ncbi:MAG: metallophosphoesterase [Lachnospiraceae bacterium]|nr:metallophosphoesterase [Lachnospiraceae bacterium]